MPLPSSKPLTFALAVATVVGLSGCTSFQSTRLGDNIEVEAAPEGWKTLSKAHIMSLPAKRATNYTIVQGAGRKVVFAQANSSASLYRYSVNPEQTRADKIRFSWKTPQLIAQADMAMRESEDSVLRVILSFEGDRSKFSAKNHMLSDLSLVLTGEEMPYATLMYVWCNKRPVGTDRIRKLVIESGPSGLGQWLEYERDIRADFIQAFGEEPGALTGIALMTDTDNTQTQATAWYGPIHFKPSLSKTSLAP
jgi:hypothetical protein